MIRPFIITVQADPLLLCSDITRSRVLDGLMPRGRGYDNYGNLFDGQVLAYHPELCSVSILVETVTLHTNQ